eukprot:1949703-Prymnesium_polylepis.1
MSTLVEQARVFASPRLAIPHRLSIWERRTARSDPHHSVHSSGGPRQATPPADSTALIPARHPSHTPPSPLITRAGSNCRARADGRHHLAHGP